MREGTSTKRKGGNRDEEGEMKEERKRNRWEIPYSWP
jgi:hypothetical protein